jgi:hypothetical protein
LIDLIDIDFFMNVFYDFIVSSVFRCFCDGRKKIGKIDFVAGFA